MKVLTYTLATGLLLFSIFALPRHFRPIPKYVSWLLDNPLDWMAIRGLMFPLTVAASIYVCLRTYLALNILAQDDCAPNRHQYRSTHSNVLVDVPNDEAGL